MITSRHMFATPNTAQGSAQRALPTAFTLIEMLTVLAVIALLTVLTVLAVPAVSSIAKDNSRAQAANQVQSLLAQARQMAVAQQRLVGVVFFEETAKYAQPVHGGQTAMQLFVEDFDQRRAAYRTSAGKYPADAGNSVFLPASPDRQYLPPGVHVAALNDDLNRQVMTGDDDKTTTPGNPNGTRGVTRAVLFTPDGRTLTRHGLARPDLGTAAPGSYPRACGDWNFTTKTGDMHMGISSPGIFIYDADSYDAAQIAPGKDGDFARNTWIKNHASVILVNANTGALLK